MRILLLGVVIFGCAATDESVANPSNGHPTSSEAGEGDGSQGEMPFQVGSSTGFAQVEARDGRRGYSSTPGGNCMVQIDWWRPMPPEPGGPMVVASSREVRVLGETREVSRTTTFEGVEQEVQMLAIRGAGVQSRIVFRECNDTEVDRFLSALSP